VERWKGLKGGKDERWNGGKVERPEWWKVAERLKNPQA
jgi:hypothetical protein